MMPATKPNHEFIAADDRVMEVLRETGRGIVENIFAQGDVKARVAKASQIRLRRRISKASRARDVKP